jgi:hypothetical protein
MANIDIQVDANLQELFNLPLCSDIQLPPPSPLKITLPFGGTMQAMADISKGLPNDCSMTFSLMVQIAPFLASITCLLNLLNLIKPLIDIINGLTSFPPSPPVQALSDFAKAIPPVLECIPIPPFLNIVFFIRDLLCLILKVLKCFVEQMTSIVNILGNIEAQLTAATAAGNTDLITALQCAQTNAQTQAAHFTASIQPISVILELASTLMEIAKVPAITLPSLGSATDLDSLKEVIQVVQGVVITIQDITVGLGGCDS